MYKLICQLFVTENEKTREINDDGEYCKYRQVNQAMAKAYPWNKQNNGIVYLSTFHKQNTLACQSEGKLTEPIYSLV